MFQKTQTSQTQTQYSATTTDSLLKSRQEALKKMGKDAAYRAPAMSNAPESKIALSAWGTWVSPWGTSL
jgi:hypothetical protein